MRQREYGGVPWYLMFTIVASIGAGFGSYVVLHEREQRLAEERARAPKPPPPPPPSTKPPEVATRAVPEEPREVPTPEEPVAETPPSVGEVTVDQAITMGDIDSVHVEIRIGAQKKAIEECYANATGSGPIVFSISVGPNGKVIGVAVVGTAFDKTLASCVSEVLKKVRFNAPGDRSTAEATIPIQFKRS